MKEIYILFTDPETWIAKSIRLFTKAKYNHVSIVLSNDFREMYSFGRKKINNPLSGGFVQEHPKQGIFAKKSDIRCLLCSLTVTDDQWEIINQYLVEMKENSDKFKYNYFGILGIVLNISIEHGQRYFCSQFIAFILEQAGIYQFGKPHALIAPHEIQTLPILNPIFEGNLHEYYEILDKPIILSGY
ncbi:hypothetical protein SAMN05877753_111104 [Bacillus oleivorans]|uniref:Permuted papain-like amidase YaeF/Yiix C92 family enzyme n=1 Tax=Bacillus oleivorans TaxID=1448271 RepID=A0A285D613_9BACI|nr:hypothetical protein [Bacillus oleivorans]SNX75250.1 hypothetical protein SAMN05877753_111104 [Bacillus oleivorans]